MTLTIEHMTPRSRTGRSTAGSPQLDVAAELRRQGDPLLHALATAPEDDEPFTAEDQAAIAQVESDRARGEHAIPLQEVMRKYQRA